MSQMSAVASEFVAFYNSKKVLVVRLHPTRPKEAVMARFLTLMIFLSASLNAMPAMAQLVDGGVTLDHMQETQFDLFGNPTFGLSAQREPELRRLRKMQGRPILEGEVSIFDLSPEEIERLYESLDDENQ